MNANTVYSKLHEQNDQLSRMRSRLQVLTSRIAGDAPTPPTSPVTERATTLGAQPKDFFLRELDVVLDANYDLMSRMSDDLVWLESVFGLGESVAPQSGKY